MSEWFDKATEQLEGRMQSGEISIEEFEAEMSELRYQLRCYAEAAAYPAGPFTPPWQDSRANCEA